MIVYDPREGPDGFQLDGLRDWTEHAARRKPWARGLSIAAVKDYDNIVTEKTAELLDALMERETKGEVVDMSAWMSYYG